MSTSTIETTASKDLTGGVKAVQQLEGGMIAALSITATRIPLPVRSDKNMAATAS